MISIWSETISVFWLVKTLWTLRSDWLRVASVLCTVDTGLQAGCTKSQSDSNTHTPSLARENWYHTKHHKLQWSSIYSTLIFTRSSEMICSDSDEALQFHLRPGNYDPVASQSAVCRRLCSAAQAAWATLQTLETLCWGLNPLQITSSDTGVRERVVLCKMCSIWTCVHWYQSVS